MRAKAKPPNIVWLAHWTGKPWWGTSKEKRLRRKVSTMKCFLTEEAARKFKPRWARWVDGIDDLIVTIESYWSGGL